MTLASGSSDHLQKNQLTLNQLTELLSTESDHIDDPERQIVELQAGQILFEQGDEGASVYVLAAGMLGVRMQHAGGTELEIDRLAPGAIVGEMALVSGKKRSATVYAVNGARLYQFSKERFNQFIAQHEGASAVIDSTTAPRWQRLQLAKAFKELFGDIDAMALHTLQERLEWRHISNGDALFNQGERSDGMYIVINGRLRVIITNEEGQDVNLGEIGPGQIVGEFGLLTDEVRTATVQAVRETNVVKITPAVFEGLVKEYPELMGRITRLIIERQQRSLLETKPQVPGSLAMALIPAQPGLDLLSFARQLETSLRPYGSTLILNSQQFDELYGQPQAAQTGPDDPSSPAIVAWMDELEISHNYLLFVADAEPSQWTSRCIGQADRILIVADAQDDPTPGAVELVLTQSHVLARTELVLWHPTMTDKPTGTGAWLDARQVQAHHHVRRDDQQHMDRLARRLTGHAIGLVLSSGGARGYAHAGIYQAMLELNIPLDYVGGSSIGALMAGVFALEPDYDELMRLAKELGNNKSIRDYTLPMTSLMASQKVTRVCQKIFGDLQIEDLWLPYFCVSTNLSRAEPVIHQRGLIWRAVRASLAIPGVFTPVIEDDEVLIDGGVMDSFPAQTMVQLCQSDRIIGVHVTPHKDRKRQYDLDSSISGWRILYHRLNPFAKKLRSPSIIGTIMRSTEINGLHRAKADENLVDLMIKPDVKRFSALNYDAYQAIIQTGYESAFEALREWQASRLVVSNGRLNS